MPKRPHVAIAQFELDGARFAILTRPLVSNPLCAADLTEAERAVMGLVAEGLTNSEIARVRGRSLATVAKQVAAVLSKSGCANRRELETRARRAKLEPARR